MFKTFLIIKLTKKINEKISYKFFKIIVLKKMEIKFLLGALQINLFLTF